MREGGARRGWKDEWGVKHRRACARSRGCRFRMRWVGMRADEEIWMRGFGDLDEEAMGEIEEAKIAGRKGILYQGG